MRLLVELWKGQIGDLELLNVELDHRGFFGSPDGAGGAAFVEAQQRVELVYRRHMHPEGVRALLADGPSGPVSDHRTLPTALLDHLRAAQGHEHEVGGGAGLLVAAKQSFDVGLH